MSNTGRYLVTVGKRKFLVEPIDNNPSYHQEWGDVDPATKKLTGSYGKKSKGSVTEKESVITEENGFSNIGMLPPGVSPMDYINSLLKK